MMTVIAVCIVMFIFAAMFGLLLFVFSSLFNSVE